MIYKWRSKSCTTIYICNRKNSNVMRVCVYFMLIYSPKCMSTHFKDWNSTNYEVNQFPYDWSKSCPCVWSHSNFSRKWLASDSDALLRTQSTWQTYLHLHRYYMCEYHVSPQVLLITEIIKVDDEKSIKGK
jgi:hypothetical protein